MTSCKQQLSSFCCSTLIEYLGLDRWFLSQFFLLGKVSDHIFIKEQIENHPCEKDDEDRVVEDDDINEHTNTEKARKLSHRENRKDGTNRPKI